MFNTFEVSTAFRFWVNRRYGTDRKTDILPISVRWPLGGKPTSNNDRSLMVFRVVCRQRRAMYAILVFDIWTLTAQTWKISRSIREIIAVLNLRLQSNTNADHVRFVAKVERTFKKILIQKFGPSTGKVSVTTASHATGYVEYCRNAKLDDNVTLRFWAINKERF